MNANKMIYMVLICVVGATAYLGWKFTARGAYESAEYTVLESDGSFEIRQYPDLMMATTSMQIAAQGQDGSFMRLFRYISGANETDQKVAMTTPVFMESETPQAKGQMGFVIPRKTAERQVPLPSDTTVQLQERGGGRFAVIRFAGRADNQSYHRAEERLRAWISKRDLIGDDDAEFAGYDPPWTPGPLRRNEVLIRLGPCQ